MENYKLKIDGYNYSSLREWKLRDRNDKFLFNSLISKVHSTVTSLSDLIYEDTILKINQNSRANLMGRVEEY